MAMSKGWKVALIVVAVLAGLGLLTVGGCVLSGYLWFQDNVPALRQAGERGQRDALEFAAGHAQSDCIDESFRRHDACGTGMEIMCRAEVRIFLDRCLENATPTPGICDGVPPQNEIMQTATWARQFCVDHEHANDQQCGNLVGAIPQYCARH